MGSWKAEKSEFRKVQMWAKVMGLHLVELLALHLELEMVLLWVHCWVLRKAMWKEMLTEASKENRLVLNWAQGLVLRMELNWEIGLGYWKAEK